MLPLSTSEIEPIIRIGLLLVGAHCTQRISSAPAQSKPGDKVTKEGAAFVFMTFLLAFQKYYTWMIAFAELALTYLSFNDTAAFANFCPSSSASAFTKPNTRLYIALAILILATALRVTAYRQLGEFFTFEVQAKEGHRLIQSGLYAWIRNPGYTGMMLFGLAYPFVYLRQEGPLACHTSWAMTLFRAALSTILSSWSIVFMRGRIVKEEAVLAAAFPDEWPRYVEKTRRFVPVISFPGN